MIWLRPGVGAGKSATSHRHSISDVVVELKHPRARVPYGHQPRKIAVRHCPSPYAQPKQRV
jgi:hypothetical protein